MANIIAAPLGGTPTRMEATTVEDVKAKLKAPTYVATVNGEPCEDSDLLNDEDFVSLSPPVKGAF